MTDELRRDVADDLMERASIAGDGRTVDLCLVRWDEVAQTPQGPETFARGAFAGTDPTTVLIESQQHAGAVDELVKATLLPLYLAPIEAHWSDLVPRTSAVRFALGELTRSDIKTRWEVYTAAHAMDALDAAEVRRLEGWGAAVNSSAMQPVPAGAPGNAPAPMEVPAA